MALPLLGLVRAGREPDRAVMPRPCPVEELPAQPQGLLPLVPRAQGPGPPFLAA